MPGHRRRVESGLFFYLETSNFKSTGIAESYLLPRLFSGNIDTLELHVAISHASTQPCFVSYDSLLLLVVQCCHAGVFFELLFGETHEQYFTSQDHPIVPLVNNNSDSLHWNV